jgi:transglutaminase-like putative cysteine protease
LLLLPFVNAEIENYNDYSSLTINYNFNTGVELSGGNQLNYLIANLTLVPLESYRQNILSLNPYSTPNANIELGDDFLTFTWNEYNSDLDMGVGANIKTENIFHKMDHIPFPIIDLDEEYEYYLQEGEKIDITDEIIDKAAEIIAGETDLYTVVFKLADWTRNNIEYDLNTLTAEAALESSWVLENRQGVCDELTALFISFARSVGIPARFISGTAYTNLNYDFGNHGWAEVYFPGYGWVPYDVTFGEYAWLNPGHVELAKTLDSANSAIRYSWLGNNIDVDPKNITIGAEVTSTGEKLDQVFDIDVKVLVDKVGPGSYVPFRVTIENVFNKYVTNTIFITKSPSQLRVNENPRPIMLKPNQDKSSFWIVKIPGNAEPGYIYTSTIEAKDIFGSTDSDTLEFSVQYDVFTQDEALALVEELEEVEDMTYSEEISLDCSTAKTYYYDFEELNVDCEIQNIGNILIRDLEVCLGNNCKTIDLNIAEEKDITLKQKNPQTSLFVLAKNEDVEIYSFMNILVLDEPDLEISSLEFKDNVEYEEEFEISFILSSEAKIKNLKILLNDLEPISIKKNKNSLPVKLNAKGKYFLDEINILLTYEDEYGNIFSLEDSKGIFVTNVPWYAEIIRLFKRIF